MMLEMSFDMKQESAMVWASMKSVFESGYSTADLSNSGDDIQMVSTVEFGDKVIARLEQLLSA